MDWTETLFTVPELIGTVAFAVSGAMAALEHRLDLFGVVLLGLTTALGGGCIRDLLLGITPPQMFCSPLLALLAVFSALLVFVPAYCGRERFFGHAGQIEQINNIFDAIGLGVFSVVGTRAGIMAGYAENAFLCVFLGMLTGVGGGVLRDMMSREIPMVLRKRIYALASILGALAYWILRKYAVDETVAALCGGIMVFGIRMLATHFCWSLPRVMRKDETKEET